MLFGTPARFAVECDVLPPSSHVVLGRVRLWIGGLPVGDFDEVCVLPGCAGWFRDTLHFEGQRADENLSGKSAAKILNTVMRALFSSRSVGNRTHEEIRRLYRQYGKFLIAPGGYEPFDGWAAVLVEETGSERFIWRGWESKTVREVRLDAGEYEAVVREFLDWLNPKIGYDLRSDHLHGKRIALTGHLTQRPRFEWEELIRQFGGRIDFDVSEDTTHIVAGVIVKGSESKLNQARKFDLPILTEAELAAMMPQNGEIQ